MAAEAGRFFARQAWVDGAWAHDVLLCVGADGMWSEVRAGAQAGEAQMLGGPVLPGLVNAHSHAFQRAIAGMTERAGGGQDNFWSWRDRMYSAALRITPQQLEAIAAQLYGELLQAGYTQVCEFQYLHNDADGRPYADAAEMSLALARAAGRVGIGLTLLPTLYMRAGFGATALREDQRRFASTPESVLRIGDAVRRQAGANVHAGVALHSLRAVDASALREVAAAARGRMPLHIHVAEQQQEVDDCLVHTGQRPIEWLLWHATLDAGWNLVHATQATATELAGLAERGAAIVICPGTEANLGDGVFDLPGWLEREGNWSIGSDSHVTRDWTEELRLLEYSQRLTLRQRNVAAGGVPRSSAGVLFEGALQGGSAASGLPLGGLAVGQRADFMVLDAQAPALLGVPTDHTLDAAIFSSGGGSPVGSVHVAGRPATRPDTAAAFRGAMQGLWS
jgi:formimidoylglutamate deiminase